MLASLIELLLILLVIPLISSERAATDASSFFNLPIPTDNSSMSDFLDTIILSLNVSSMCCSQVGQSSFVSKKLIISECVLCFSFKVARNSFSLELFASTDVLSVIDSNSSLS